VALQRTAEGEDEGFVARCRAGDVEALDQMARRELPRVTRLLHRLLGPRKDMEDLVQTVFLEACRAIPGFRGESSLGTFVGAIAVRVARRAMRPPAWSTRREVMVAEPVAPSRGEGEPAVQATVQLRRLQAALERLSEPKRVAFVLWALEGIEPGVIAEMTGASLAATRSRIFYAQKELREMAAADPYLAELVGGGAEENGGGDAG
jgi:RNA polymerase sigma-70 factor (ECF subfamily)